MSQETEKEVELFHGKEITYPQRSKDQFPGTSKEDVPIVFDPELIGQATEISIIKHIKVSEITPIPPKKKVAIFQRNQATGKPKGKSVILMATPEKMKLQMILSIKRSIEKES